METAVIVAGARTPVGKLLGSLADMTAVDLGQHAIRGAIHRSSINVDGVDAVVMGNVVQAAVGANPARQAAVAAGIPMSVPAVTLNKLCLSGLAAVASAGLAIRAGQWTTAIAGGMESMTNAPFLVRGARKGFKYGSTRFEDALDRDALICSLENEVMGAATDRHQRPLGITRDEQDAFALASHQRAAAATVAGRLAEEIAPINVATRTGDLTIDADEGIRGDASADGLASLSPAFGPDGTITAASASQLSDGAAAVVVMSKREAEARGLSWLAEIVSYGSVAGPDPSLLLQPAGAIRDAVRRTDGITVADLDLLEMNEAFASVALASARDLDVDLERVNVNGGAIAIGHPVGMSGARLVLSLALELRRRGGGLGAAALCGGGGQGDALIIRVP